VRIPVASRFVPQREGSNVRTRRRQPLPRRRPLAHPRLTSRTSNGGQKAGIPHFLTAGYTACTARPPGHRHAARQRVGARQARTVAIGTLWRETGEPLGAGRAPTPPPPLSRGLHSRLALGWPTSRASLIGLVERPTLAELEGHEGINWRCSGPGRLRIPPPAPAAVPAAELEFMPGALPSADGSALTTRIVASSSPRSAPASPPPDPTIFTMSLGLL